ncbi:DUF1992 domain-containing protein [Piscinibacter aquaticus]|uniref:DUF1992 domain-containing protein n=1 Tax=Piscinibacter aquaticus TaxID=392597 RepID=A0A5C6TNL5_9BURK|nr:DUF1992 domain-containing protein [Piscinibacter aquaticus]
MPRSRRARWWRATTRPSRTRCSPSRGRSHEPHRRFRSPQAARCGHPLAGRRDRRAPAQAQRSGELRSAPSFGKPLAEAEGWSETPTEFRLPFKILKNAGVPPPEIEMFHQRAALREQLAAAASDDERRAIAARLSEVEQAIALRLEGMRASGRL